MQITGAGGVFCAGADLSEMQAQAEASEAANLEDAEQLASMLALLDSMPKPTLARVNGDGYGGALGLLGACDIVVAADDAKFAFTEVRLGDYTRGGFALRAGQDRRERSAALLLDGGDTDGSGSQGAWAGARSGARR